MTNWNDITMLTNGLKHLGSSINMAYTRRKTASDGAIGDYAHTQEDSGHNPDDTSHHNAEWDGDSDNKPEIRAIDVDKDLDPDNPNAAQELVDHIVGMKPSSVLRYVIYNRHMWHERDNWERTAYTGASAHTEHIHFSGAWTNASDENVKYNYHLEDLVMLTAQEIADAILDSKIGNDNYPNRTVRAALNDLSTERDGLVDPLITLKEAGIDSDSPLGRIIAAADKVIATK